MTIKNRINLKKEETNTTIELNNLGLNYSNSDITDNIISNYSYHLQKPKDIYREKKVTNILYIPEKVKEKLDQTLSQNPPAFNVKNQTDYFIYIIHLLYDIPARNRNIDLDKNNGFVPVYRQLLKKRVDDYLIYLNYLLDNKIIEKGKKHKVGVNSSELRINPNLISDLIPVEISKPTLIKSINKFQDVSRYYKQRNEAVNNTSTFENISYSYLDRHFNDKLKINKEDVYNFLSIYEANEKEKIKNYKTKSTRIKKEIKLQYKIHISKYRMEYLNAGNFYNNVDNNVGRYNSILTNIKSELRNYITYDNQRLYTIDVVSSHPYLSISLFDDKLFKQNKMEQRIRKFWKSNKIDKERVTITSTTTINNNRETEIDNNIFMIRNFIKENQFKEDVLEYKKLILSGEFYEKFADYILQENPSKKFKDNDSRKYAKLALLKTIFADAIIEKYGDYIPVFKKHFPTVYQLFQLIKFNGKQHHILACILQHLEAETFLDNVCGELSTDYPNIVLYTIHDSIITTQNYIEVVEQALTKKLFNVVGEKPKFKIECWQEKIERNN